MYNVDFIAFMEKLEKTWNDILAKQMQKRHQNQLFLIRGLTFKKITFEFQFLRGFGEDIYALRNFTRQP